jgi:hypothetical protein
MPFPMQKSNISRTSGPGIFKHTCIVRSDICSIFHSQTPQRGIFVQTQRKFSTANVLYIVPYSSQSSSPSHFLPIAAPRSHATHVPEFGPSLAMSRPPALGQMTTRQSVRMSVSSCVGRIRNPESRLALGYPGLVGCGLRVTESGYSDYLVR